MRVHFTNLGCKLNQAEIERLAREFAAAGHEVVASLAEADLHVVNSCTVTHVAARGSRKEAGRARRSGFPVRTVLTGCYATERPDEAARLAGVDLVVPNAEKDRLLARVHEAFPDAAPGVPVPYVPMPFGHTRALVKFEDGCNMRCAFCIIPTTRGRQRPAPASARGAAGKGRRGEALFWTLSWRSDVPDVRSQPGADGWNSWGPEDLQEVYRSRPASMPGLP